MKKILAIVLALMLVFGALACSKPAASSAPAEAPKAEAPKAEEPKAEAPKAEEPKAEAPAAEPAAEPAPEEPAKYVPTGHLVVYTASSQDQQDLELEMWNALYPDCQLEFISAGSGELTARIEAEKDNPKADVMIGGSASIYAGLEPYLAPYVSPEKVNILPSFSGDTDLYTPVQLNVNTIIVNNDLLAKSGLTIDGWESLLQEGLKGQISFVDPAASSSAREQIINMLCAEATKAGDSMDDHWEFAKAFLANLDGKMHSSSSKVPEAVANGEYIVGITNEELVLTLMLDGVNVSPVYAKEGITLRNSFMGLIKDGPNPENGKAFIDFMLSHDVQQAHADQLHQRSVRPDVAFAGLEGVPSSDQLPALMYPTDWVNANKDLKAKLQDIIANLAN